MRKVVILFMVLMAVTFSAYAEDWYTRAGGGIIFSDFDSVGDMESLEQTGASPYYEIGFGYTGLEHLRLEFDFAHYLDYDMRVRDNAMGDAGNVVLRETRNGATYSGWMWSYYEPEEIAFGELQPFVGVGLGVSYLDTYPTDGFRMSYGAAAGVALSLGDRMTVDLAYRYVDLSPFTHSVDHDHHGMFVGLRFSFD